MSVASSALAPVWTGDEWRRRLWWTILGLAEMGSEHPVAKAILRGAKDELGLEDDGFLDGSVGEFRATVGKGISAQVEPASAAQRIRYSVLAGNVRFLQENGVEIPQDVVDSSEKLNSDAGKRRDKESTAGTTTVFVAIDSKYAGCVSLADTVKEDAAGAISILHRMGVKTAMVTGDEESTALAVAAAVGISPEDVYAGASPDKKQSIVRQMQAQGEIVGMVGDGINDSPALATADVGIAMASGTDVAMEAADVVLMRPTQLMDVPSALHLTRSIFRRIKLNLGWACLYNVIGLPVAMGFFLPLGFHMHPMLAGFAMACSSVSVVVSSLLLKFWRRPRWMDDAAAAAAASEGRGDGGGGGVEPRWMTGRGVAGWAREMFRRRRMFKGAQEQYVPLQNMEV